MKQNIQPRLNISHCVVNFYFLSFILAIYGERNPGVPHRVKMYLFA